jgi:hypothetical protein
MMAGMPDDAERVLGSAAIALLTPEYMGRPERATPRAITIATLFHKDLVFIFDLLIEVVSANLPSLFTGMTKSN